MEPTVEATATSGTSSESAIPVPVRYWWLKRIAAVVAIVTVLLVGARWWWGTYSHRLLQAEIESIRAAGEPIFPEDFASTPVRDEDNAALVYLKAARLLEESGLAVDPLFGSDQYEGYFDDVRNCIETNAEVFVLTRQARNLAELDWGIQLAKPVITTLLPSISGQREVSRALCAAGLYYHQIADDVAAVETLRDALAQGEALNRQSFLISHLVAIAITSMTAQSIEAVTPDLRIADTAAPVNASIKPVTRDQVRALIDDLLGETYLREGLVRSFYGERMSLLDAALCVTGGTTSLNEINGLFGGGVSTPIMAYGQRVFFRPMFELDAVRMLRHGTRQLEAIREPTWPAVQKELPEFVLQTSWMGRVTHWLSQMLSPAIDRAIMLHFRGLAQRRMAAIALALRLYEIDHGRRPAELSELVPEYLPAVPADPFASDGRSIAFRTTPHGALLYSVNTDGVDDQGQVAIDRNGNLRGDDKDLPFALDGQDLIAAATQPASTQAAVDHDDNVENGAGNADEDQSGRQQP